MKSARAGVTARSAASRAEAGATEPATEATLLLGGRRRGSGCLLRERDRVDARLLLGLRMALVFVTVLLVGALPLAG